MTMKLVSALAASQVTHHHLPRFSSFACSQHLPWMVHTFSVVKRLPVFLPASPLTARVSTTATYGTAHRVVQRCFSTKTTAPLGLDLTPKGLFLKNEDAAQDPKCLVIAEVIQQLTKNSDMSAVTQETLQNRAENRYVDLSQQGKLSLPDVDHRAFLLYQKGVSVETAQKYYSFRLSEADAKIWKIVLV